MLLLRECKFEYLYICRLKSTLPRKNKISDDELLEGQRSPFSGTNLPEEINNTVAELRSQNNSSNMNHSETINSIEIPLNSTFDEKNSANLTMPNSGKYQIKEKYLYVMRNSFTCVLILVP